MRDVYELLTGRLRQQTSLIMNKEKLSVKVIHGTEEYWCSESE